ncbi:hypothetical protein J7I86_11780 [Arthrobacter sp. ISL-95]|nr:hypothetical protein [Arthrobacter sp. ISL-95]
MQIDGWGSVLWHLSLLVGVVALHWVLLSTVNGYRPVNKGEALSETGSLWHLTRSAALLEQVRRHGRVTISPSRCRPMARMFNRARPLAIPRRAVYVFSAMPEQQHVRQNVSQSQMVGLLVLDARAVKGDVYGRSRDGALALLEGYDGPAEVLLRR